MKIVCIYCEREGRRALIREHEPLENPEVTHGICSEHRLELKREIADLWNTPDEPPRRRGFPRLSISLPVVARAAQEGGGEAIQGMVRNISAGGLMLELPVALAPGTAMDLEIQARVGPLALKGRIIWSAAAGGTVRHGVVFPKPKGHDFGVDLFLG